MEYFMQPEVLMLLAGVALVAGFVDTLAGGGGLIVIPALLLAQVPPVYAIATNKLQGCFGTLTSATTMIRRDMVSRGRVRIPFAMAFAGAMLGAFVIQKIPAGIVDKVIPLVLISIALYFICAKSPGEVDTPETMPVRIYNMTVVPLIGFYDGAFGPGAGSFYTLGGVALAGKNLIRATANAKVLNFASNLAALIIFILGGKVLWVVGAVMSVGTILGAWLGSLVIIHRGTQIIRPAIVTMSLIMLCTYLLKTYS
jgi:uncharacterized membrane protein YfcA